MIKREFNKSSININDKCDTLNFEQLEAKIYSWLDEEGIEFYDINDHLSNVFNRKK